MRKEYDFSRAKRGAVIPQTGKSRISIYLDDKILEEFRARADAAGRGYQTMINDALREYLGRSARPLDVETLRKILREELKSAWLTS
jgi:uncharacterized protein (DUF4415 family)